jgi:uncharacterized membrane protein YcaP (DUF421 family)
VDPLRIAVRALAAFIYLLILTRASGKRVIAQAPRFDFIVSLIVGDLIDDALWAEVSVARFAGAAGTIFACDVMIKMFAWRSPRFFRLVEGVPAIVFRDGAPDDRSLRREQLNKGDLEHLIRLQGISNAEEIRFGILERDDTLSVIRHPSAEPLQRLDADALEEKKS